MASTLSRTVYRGLVAAQGPRLARRLRSGAPILCFHNVVSEADAGVGDASLHMPVDTFESIAGWLAATYDVVPLRELADRASSGRSVRGLAALTFDDAYRGVFDHALPVLAALGLPCTLFVVSGFADRPAWTWWDTLASRGLLSEERRDEALSASRGLAAEVLSGDGNAVDARSAAFPEVLLPATWDRIVAAAGESVALGSHTARHPNLCALSEDELDEELGRSRREIHERAGVEPDALAYPYGLWDARVVRAAGGAGYRTGLTLESRGLGTNAELLAAPRINVPAGIPLEALECWLAGLKLRRPW